MSTYAKEVAERLAILVDGGSKNAFAKACHIPERTFASYFEGTVLSLENAVKISHARGVSLAWIATGEGAPAPGFQPGLGEPTSVAIGPLVDLRPMAVWHGNPVIADSAEPLMALPLGSLRKLGVDPLSAGAFQVTAANASPNFPEGTVLVIDTAGNGLGAGRHQLQVSGDELLLRRIHKRVDGAFDVVADDPSMPREKVASLSKLKSAGSVVYAARPV